MKIGGQDLHARVSRVSADSEDLDLRRIAKVLRRRALWILGSVVLLVGGLLGRAATETPSYTAVAELLLQPRDNENINVGVDSRTVANLPARTLATEVRVIESRAVAALANKKLGFRSSIDATGIADADIVRIVAAHPDAGKAALVANTFATQYIAYRKAGSVEDRIAAADELDSRISQQEKQLEALASKIATLPPAEASTRQTLELTRTALVTQVSVWRNRSDALRLEATLRTGGARIINPAEIPASPTSPKPARSLILGILFGLVLGIGLAFSIDLLDDRVRSKEDLDSMNLGIPVLGLIPKSNAYKRSEVPELESFMASTSPVAEAYRTLRSAVQFAGIERDLKVLLVTSTDAAESKSTTAANLAVTLARSGNTVCLIDADLRNPRLHMFFGVRQKEGLTNVLLGSQRPPDVIVSFAELEDLGMMPAGPKAPNPAELLGSNRMSVLLNALKKRFDLVIIDSPPILPVVDSLELARQADGVLLTTLVGRTKRRGLGHAVELLNNVDAPLLGIVLTGVDKSSSYGYGYGYGYGEDENASKPRRGKASQALPVAQAGLTVRPGTERPNGEFPNDEFIVSPDPIPQTEPASTSSSEEEEAPETANANGTSVKGPKDPANAIKPRFPVTAGLGKKGGRPVESVEKIGGEADDVGPVDADGDPVIPVNPPAN
jgi:polysaccharide biosynthesis transport protein